MFSGAEEHVIYQVANAPLRTYPYPHIYVDSVFPQDFYAVLRRNWPRAEHLVSLASTNRVTSGAYAERFIMPLKKAELEKLPEAAREFWTEFSEWLLAERFLDAMVGKFDEHVRERFGKDAANVGFGCESLVVRDHTNYNLRPHTDSPLRVLSLVFYCPDDESMKHLGTSIYTPIDPDFRCPGGPHHPHNLFRKVATMEYRPNTLFAFMKTDNSFHGVEPIGDAGVLRDLLLYDIQVKKDSVSQQARPSGAARGIGLRILRNIFGGRR
jgi:hypothetical protein